MKALACSYFCWIDLDKGIENLGKFCESCQVVKWPEVVVMNSTTSHSTTEALRTLFGCYGLPKQLVSDNGSQASLFTSFTQMK